jgi:mercuric ion transport protein
MACEKGDRLLKLGIVGTILGCVACFTPAAVVPLGLLGLAQWTGYLDYVLFPLLGLFLMLVAYGIWQRRQAQRHEPKV